MKSICILKVNFDHRNLPFDSQFNKGFQLSISQAGRAFNTAMSVANIAPDEQQTNFHFREIFENGYTQVMLV